ncbi:MAG TPA: ABC transporter permease [bacterium]|nr:ABC transporter permease [bacterium]HPS31431.1 ABC transporter permease [bacterium]
MILLKMAFRNILKQKRRTFFTLFSMVIGFVLLSVSYGFNDGGYSNIIKAFTKARTGHIQIHKKGYLEKPGLYSNFVWDDLFIKTVSSIDSIESFTPRIHSGGLAFLDKKTTAVQIKGIDPEREAETTLIDRKIESGSYLSSSGDVRYETVVTRSLADILNLKTGDDLIIISSGADGSIANDRFKVIGIFSKDLDSLYGNAVFIPLNTTQEFLVLDGKIHEVAVMINNYKNSFDDSMKISGIIKSAGIQNISVEPWEIVEEQFFKSMNADKEGTVLVVIIIMLVVGVGVLNTVLMSILERMREYGVMKAMGTTPSFIFFSIVIETFLMSFFASVAGLVMSLLANWPMKVYGISYPEPVSIGGIFIETINSEYVAIAFYLPVIVIIVSSVVASIIPAYKAASAEPVKSMRSY